MKGLNRIAGRILPLLSAVSLGNLAFAVSVEAQASALRLCGQTVEYRPTTPEANAPQKAPAFNGVWEGDIRFSSAATQCVAFAIETMGASGAVKVKYAYNRSADTGAVNSAPSSGVAALDGKIEGDTLQIFAANGSIFVLRISDIDRLSGTINLTNKARYPVALLRH